MQTLSHSCLVLVFAVLLLATPSVVQARNDTTCFTMYQQHSKKSIRCEKPGFVKKGVQPFKTLRQDEYTCGNTCANTDACATFSSNGVICNLYREAVVSVYTPNKLSPTKFWSSLCYECVPFFGQQQQLVAIMQGKRYYIHKPVIEIPLAPKTTIDLILSPHKKDFNTFGINGTGAVLTTDSPHRYIAFSASPNEYGTRAIKMETQTRFNSQGSPFSSILNCVNPNGDIDKLDCKTSYGSQFYSCTKARYLSLRSNNNMIPDPTCTPVEVRPAYFACTGCS